MAGRYLVGYECLSSLSEYIGGVKVRAHDFSQVIQKAWGVFSCKTTRFIIIIPGGFDKEAISTCLEHGSSIIDQRFPGIKHRRNLRVMESRLPEVKKAIPAVLPDPTTDILE